VHIVDDDAFFRTAIERRLTKAGYEVATYASAQQLLDRLPSDSVPSCVLPAFAPVLRSSRLTITAALAMMMALLSLDRAKSRSR